MNTSSSSGYLNSYPIGGGIGGYHRLYGGLYGGAGSDLGWGFGDGGNNIGWGDGGGGGGWGDLSCGRSSRRSRGRRQ